LTDTRMQLSELYINQANNYRQQNDLIQAKKSYQLALTADPNNTFAKKQLDTVESQLQQLAENYYQKSVLLKKNGKYSEAKRYLLISLRHWPSHELSRQDLMTSQTVSIKKFITHTIVSGDTISKISKLYYGNFKQSELIAQANNIKDARKIRIGMKLKIPEIKKHPFINIDAAEKIEIEQVETKEEIPVEQKVDPIAMYKNLGLEFYNDKQYENAVVEFKKVLNAVPTEKETQALISKTYLKLGSQANTRSELNTAIKNYQNALLYDDGCLECKNNLIQAKNKYKAKHYKAGMKYFDQQNLKQAILEWKMVQKLDPKYKKVTELLAKAQTIQKNIDALKKSE